MLERRVSNHSRKHYLQITAFDYYKETFFPGKGIWFVLSFDGLH